MLVFSPQAGNTLCTLYWPSPRRFIVETALCSIGVELLTDVGVGVHPPHAICNSVAHLAVRVNDSL